MDTSDPEDWQTLPSLARTDLGLEKAYEVRAQAQMQSLAMSAEAEASRRKWQEQTRQETESGPKRTVGNFFNFR